MSATDHARIVRMVDQVATYWNSGAWRGDLPPRPGGRKLRLVE